MNEETMKILADAAMLHWDGSMAQEMETLAEIITSAATSPMANEGGEAWTGTDAVLLDDPDENGLRADEVTGFPHPVSAASGGYDGTYIVVPRVV